MADRYWVGGAGIWDTTNTTYWAASSGGAGGTPAPGAEDNVFFDGNSGSGGITVGNGAKCLDLDLTGSNVSVYGFTGVVELYGNLIGYVGTGYFAAPLILRSTTTGKTITSNGMNIYSLLFDGVGGEWTLQDDLSVSYQDNGVIELKNGSFNTNNKNIICRSFKSSNTNIRTLELGSSTITILSYNSSTHKWAWEFSVTTNLTFNAGTSTISITGEVMKTDDCNNTYDLLFHSSPYN